jgi:predicted glycoside hydrolase/deacetylase ChbG (UPF0249 family)
VTPKRYLIVNADDFGLSTGVNAGIIASRENGIVTSASLMVRQPAAEEAADYGRRHPEFSVGLHVDLGEWVHRGGEWVRSYEVVPPDDREAIAAEVARQLERFRDLMARNPTHIDSHQHVHRDEPARSVLVEAARALDVPLRHFGTAVGYCGSFYGQTAKGEPFPRAISVEGLCATLASLPPGTTELACHPGSIVDFVSDYAGERAEEVKALCDTRVKDALRDLGIELVSFHDVNTHGPAS